MSKIRTLEQLSDALSGDLAWRKRELVTWTGMLVGARAREHEQAVLLRGAWALLYAHWEGYVKLSCQAYLQYVSNQGLLVADLSTELAAIALRGTITSLAESKQLSSHTQLVQSIRSDQLPAYLPFDNSTIRTYSNLTFSVFEEILRSVGCDPNRYEHLRDEIDKRLVVHRNSIAHGRQLLVDFRDWDLIREQVVPALNDVQSKLENAAAMKMYRRLPVKNK